MEQLKEAVKLAVRLCQNPDTSILQAADEACEQLGLDLQATTPVFLLLTCAWNSTLSWANETPDKLFKDKLFNAVLNGAAISLDVPTHMLNYQGEDPRKPVTYMIGQRVIYGGVICTICAPEVKVYDYEYWI